VLELDTAQAVTRPPRKLVIAALETDTALDFVIIGGFAVTGPFSPPTPTGTTSSSPSSSTFTSSSSIAGGFATRPTAAGFADPRPAPTG